MSTLFISDLHLEQKQPQTTELLCSFLRGRAREADALYVLGDLFEFWIGDDVVDETASRVADELSQLQHAGVACYFLHGNRDFLIGQDYASKAGFTLLPESLVIDFYGVPTLLLHGDTLCIDDVEYQKFRLQVRDPQFQSMFLRLPVEQRLAMAAQARDASKRHTGSASMGIMDVNEQAVIAAFEQHGVSRMIHGHTHRPAFHRHAVPGSSTAERIVLSDWCARGSFLRLSSEGYTEVPLAT